MLRMGVIGYGSRISGIVQMIGEFKADTRLVAVADPQKGKVADRLRKQGFADVRLYDDADEMLEKETLEGVLIGTRCSLHSRMAVKVLKRNLPLYLEKPIATNMADLKAIAAAARKTKSPTVVSFPLRVTPLVQIAKEILDSGKIGAVEHVQAWNNVPYGYCYFQGWYRDENETGGLFLQKATHDFDYLNYLLKLAPRTLCAMTSKQIMKGDKPAGLRCVDCDDQEECLESPFHAFYTRGEAREVGLELTQREQCCFAVDTGNEDSGSALIEYETGMHACYSQNFFARKAAGARGARLLGYLGTLEFDWFTDEVKVFVHHSPRTETIKVDTTKLSHGGGDHVLVKNFIDLMRGVSESIAPLEAGLLSVLMCLKAKESARTRTFQDIDLAEIGLSRGDLRATFGTPSNPSAEESA
ncbi:MAG: Gfo/Idh/MocA family oxidoreductase [Planctomycetota bacterium]